MTVEDSALRTPEVTYALASSLACPKDQELLNRMNSSELVGKGYHSLIGVIFRVIDFLIKTVVFLITIFMLSFLL